MRGNLRSRLHKPFVFKVIGMAMSITAAVVWTSTVATLFGQWAGDHFNRYDPDDGQVIYISSGASKRRKGFILGTVTTSIPYFLTVLFTTLYYNTKPLHPLKRLISVLSVISTLFACVSLIVLAPRDSIRHKGTHYTFLGIFISCVLITAVLQIIYRFKSTQINWVLGFLALFVGLYVPSIVAFIVTSVIGTRTARESLKSVAGTIEWALALFLIPYFGSFAVDLGVYR